MTCHFDSLDTRRDSLPLPFSRWHRYCIACGIRKRKAYRRRYA